MIDSLAAAHPRISVVTPTLKRPQEVADLLENLSHQKAPIFELILVDGAPDEETATEQIAAANKEHVPYLINYIRHGGGTAVQRNVGIDAAAGDFVAFIDDDIRLEEDYFEKILEIYQADHEIAIGGIAGYITNQYLDPQKSIHWRWYRKLKFFTTYEPGRFDYQSGYPINRYLQPPHEGVREIDFMGSNCAVWRREVIDSGLRFSEFFVGYGMLEDTHFALRAKQRWTLLECGRAHCVHLHAKSGRENHRMIARKTAENYRYVFMDLVPERSFRQEFYFWRVQFFDLFRYFIYALVTRENGRWQTVIGKFEGIIRALQMDRVEETNQQLISGIIH